MHPRSPGMGNWLFDVDELLSNPLNGTRVTGGVVFDMYKGNQASTAAAAINYIASLPESVAYFITVSDDERNLIITTIPKEV